MLAALPAVGAPCESIPSARCVPTDGYRPRGASDWLRLALPAAAILLAAMLAALPAAVRAVRVDPVRALRAD